LYTYLFLDCRFPFVDRRDWPEYRGPKGDAFARDPESELGGQRSKVLWKAPVKNGFSSFTIADGKAFTQMKSRPRGANREVCVAFNASTGKEIWAVPVGVGSMMAVGLWHTRQQGWRRPALDAHSECRQGLCVQPTPGPFLSGC